MLFEIMISLRMYLDSKITESTKTQMIYDGVKLTGLTKPFLTLQHLMANDLILAAGRTSYQSTYNFQIGVFARDFQELIKLQEKVATELRKPIPLYDETYTDTGKTFVCDVSDFSPIGNDDVASETFNFRGYFDVSVTILRDNGSKEFTQ
ncbi:hypothetical protein ACTHHL_04315 [Aeribacillus composti]|uniref:hypothetical protein n=1 Tax=Aeribacillus composti TaxID=1868734 RepID=UPI00406A81B0